MVFTLEMFEKISQRLNRMNMTDPSVRQLKRLLYSSADRVDPDRAGRILVPQFLREVAMLESEAVIVGIGDYFEIWSPEMWQEQETVLKDSSANSQRFAAFDLSGE
jgi:MraZ protein